MSIAEAPVRPARAEERETDPSVLPRQTEPAEGPDFPGTERGRVAEPEAPQTIPDTPGEAEPEPDPDGDPGGTTERVRGYMFEGYFYSA